MTGLSPAAIRNVQIAAWIAIGSACLLFLLLVAGGPWLAWTAAQTATVSPRAAVRVRAGDVQFQRIGESLSVAEGRQASAGEGTSITPLGTGGSSAFVRFFDDSTAMLEQRGTLTLDEIRRNRFDLGDVTRRIVLRLTPAAEGTSILRLGTTPDGYDGLGPATMVLNTPHATLALAGGTHVIVRADADVLRVLVSEGQATLTAGARPAGPGEQAPARVIVRRGERTEIRMGQPPLPATDEPIDLLVNGDFASARGDHEGWQLIGGGAGGQPSPPNPPSAVRVVDDERRAALRLWRIGGEGTPADIVLRQTFDNGFQLADVRELEVAATLRVDAQSLPGGGDRGVEFPLILILTFEDEGGTEHVWQVGFYAVPPNPEGGAFPGATVDPARDVQVPLDEWFDYSSGNLLDPSTPQSLVDVAGGGRPALIRRIEIKASGHDFDSRVDTLRLRWR